METFEPITAEQARTIMQGSEVIEQTLELAFYKIKNAALQGQEHTFIPKSKLPADERSIELVCDLLLTKGFVVCMRDAKAKNEPSYLEISWPFRNDFDDFR